ncbi:MAG: NHL repeat-containing protein [Coriobacteriia bacterium]
MRKVVTARFWLIAAIVVLLGVLALLLRLFLEVADPPAIVKTQQGGMEWEQSIYGWGPADDQQFRAVYSVAVGPGGDIFATDPSQSRILVFSRFGEYKRTVQAVGDGTEPGQFKTPASIDVDNLGRLYVADSSARKIVVFDENGGFVREWTVATQARGVDVESGEVYVLGEGVIYVYDLSGSLLRQWGSRGKAPGQIDAYQGIAVHEDRVYLADAYNKRIQAFDTNGTLAWTNPETATASPSHEASAITEEDLPFGWDLPTDITVDGAGRLVVVDAFRFQIVVLEASGGSLIESYGDFGTAEGQFFYPTSIEFDSDRDRFIVADTQNRRVQIVTIPRSGGSGAVATALRRLEASPSRFLVIPAAVLLLIFVSALVQSWRWKRRDARAAGQ